MTKTTKPDNQLLTVRQAAAGFIATKNPELVHDRHGHEIPASEEERHGFLHRNLQNNNLR